MKILFVALMLMISSNALAQAEAIFTIYVRATVEDDVESILDSKAMAECNGYPAKRTSSIHSNYKPYRYYITVWANYICESKRSAMGISQSMSTCVDLPRGCCQNGVYICF